MADVFCSLVGFGAELTGFNVMGIAASLEGGIRKIRVSLCRALWPRLVVFGARSWSSEASRNEAQDVRVPAREMD